MLKIDLTGDEFKNLLKEAGISQKEFARLLNNSSLSTVSKELNEKRDRKVPPDYLYTLIVKVPEHKVLISLFRLEYLDRKEFSRLSKNRN